MTNMPQVFLLHFAGGNCYSFREMQPFLAGFDVVPLELPGRGRRTAEPLLHDFDAAAADLRDQMIAKLSSSRFAIYGHSMGAYLALRVSNLLKMKGRPPLQLFVSGNPGPLPDSDKGTYRLKGDAFTDALKKLGGIPQGILDNRELFEFFEPILRADFEIAEKHNLEHEPVTDVPIYAMMGSLEEKVERISNWGRFTSGRFGYEIMEGDHFFINQHARRVASIIDRGCKSYLYKEKIN